MSMLSTAQAIKRYGKPNQNGILEAQSIMAADRETINKGSK